MPLSQPNVSRAARPGFFHTIRRIGIFNIGKPTKDDLVAGLTVAVVALPLAIAYGLASGATAASGLYASIFGGLFASLFGGSRVSISGPTGTMVVVLTGISASYGLPGIILAGMMAGMMQIALGIGRAGSLIKFLPHSLTVGFTTGIAVIIFKGMLPDFFAAPIVGGITIVAMVAIRRLWPKVPAALAALLLGSLVNLLLKGPVVSGVPKGLPLPGFVGFDIPMLAAAFSAAVTICLLGSIEGLLSATVADSMMGTRHNSNKELIGQGIGNIASTLFGGIPIAGVIARTGVAVRSGAKTPWTGIIHSLVLLVVVLFLAPLARFIPMASLAAILMVTSFNMVEWESLRLIPKAPSNHNIVLLITLGLTIFGDITLAVGVGFTLATLLFTLKMTRQPLEQVDLSLSEHLEAHVSVQALTGPLFFGVADRFLEKLEATEKSVLVLDMHRVPMVDSTGAMMLRRLDQRLRQRGGGLVVYGLDQQAKESLKAFDVKDVSTYSLVDTREELESALTYLLGRELRVS